MSNFIYDKAAGSLWKAEIDWELDDTKVVLLRGHTPDKVNHQFLSDIPTGERVAITPSLANAIVNGRAIDADDPVFSAVPAGPDCEAIALFIDTGTPATSRLVAYADTATGLPATPNGTDITVIFNVAGIATL